MNVRWCWTTFLALGLVGGGFALGDELTFQAYDIGHLVCSEPATLALDINDFGVVVGASGAPPCPPTQTHATAWFNGVMTDVSATTEGPPLSVANGIGRYGTMAVTGTGLEDVVFVSDGVGMEIGPPDGCSFNSNPDSINESGTMIGGNCTREGTGSFAPAIYWTADGSAVALDLLPDAPADADGYTQDMNDSGVVVGYFSYPGDEGTRGFIWVDGVMTELVNTLGGGDKSSARAISNSGFIAGGTDTPEGVRAMRYDMNTGEMIALGSGIANDVNDRGDAVGSAFIGGPEHAMLYKHGATIDLQPALPEYMAESYGVGINRYGWIVGIAYSEDYESWWGWLLVPVYDKGDYDGDGDVDFQDSGHFQRCFAAEDYIDGTLHVGCSVFDFDDDVNLDLDDYAGFQSAFTGPTAPNLNPNGPG